MFLRGWYLVPENEVSVNNCVECTCAPSHNACSLKAKILTTMQGPVTCAAFSQHGTDNEEGASGMCTECSSDSDIGPKQTITENKVPIVEPDVPLFSSRLSVSLSVGKGYLINSKTISDRYQYR